MQKGVPGGQAGVPKGIIFSVCSEANGGLGCLRRVYVVGDYSIDEPISYV